MITYDITEDRAALKIRNWFVITTIMDLVTIKTHIYVAGWIARLHIIFNSMRFHLIDPIIHGPSSDSSILGRFDWNFRYDIFNLILIFGRGTSVNDIALIAGSRMDSFGWSGILSAYNVLLHFMVARNHQHKKPLNATLVSWSWNFMGEFENVHETKSSIFQTAVSQLWWGLSTLEGHLFIHLQNEGIQLPY